MKVDKLISLDETVVQRNGNITSDMGGEKVMLSITNGKYYNLGEIGGEIWGLIESPIQIRKIVDQLTDSYNVENSVCQEQVLVFLEQLFNEGLIEKR
ncbi:lasso peptide biosynthesis PqqD family chaperone [Neobacillus sp. YIM B06451]|uniref:lasso peptide biosynthesis PqqD family chaperone n=1 Tax=Neobacillus sp. YIM B06451 TaxID=3070994 RepID=UPI00292EB26E|nr:lasso peptide biosynthesis PqqD family chaperone [Neobacillus sp. YIM B06451]